MIHDPVNAELSPAIDHGPRGWRYASATPSGVAQPIEEEEMEARERKREKQTETILSSELSRGSYCIRFAVDCKEERHYVGSLALITKRFLILSYHQRYFRVVAKRMLTLNPKP